MKNASERNYELLSQNKIFFPKILSIFIQIFVLCNSMTFLKWDMRKVIYSVIAAELINKRQSIILENQWWNFFKSTKLYRVFNEKKKTILKRNYSVEHPLQSLFHLCQPQNQQKFLHLRSHQPKEIPHRQCAPRLQCHDLKNEANSKIYIYIYTEKEKNQKTITL